MSSSTTDRWTWRSSTWRKLRSEQRTRPSWGWRWEERSVVTKPLNNYFQIVIQRRLLSLILTTFIPTIILNVIGHMSNYFKEFFFEGLMGLNVTVMLVLTTMFLRELLIGINWNCIQIYFYQCQHQPPPHRLHQDDRLLAHLQSPQTLRGHHSPDLHWDAQGESWRWEEGERKSWSLGKQE